MIERICTWASRFWTSRMSWFGCSFESIFDPRQCFHKEETIFHSKSKDTNWKMWGEMIPCLMGRRQFNSLGWRWNTKSNNQHPNVLIYFYWVFWTMLTMFTSLFWYNNLIVPTTNKEKRDKLDTILFNRFTWAVTMILNGVFDTNNDTNNDIN
jgi:hypothetical protein